MILQIPAVTGHGCSVETDTLTGQHVCVGVVRHGEEMGRHLVPPLAPVFADHVRCVDGQALVRVHHDAEKTRVCLQEPQHSSVNRLKHL